VLCASGWAGAWLVESSQALFRFLHPQCDVDRRFCFELITPDSNIILQSLDEKVSRLFSLFPLPIGCRAFEGRFRLDMTVKTGPPSNQSLADWMITPRPRPCSRNSRGLGISSRRYSTRWTCRCRAAQAKSTSLRMLFPVVEHVRILCVGPKSPFFFWSLPIALKFSSLCEDTCGTADGCQLCGS
jgi:hypothetical protein